MSGGVDRTRKAKDIAATEAVEEGRGGAAGSAGAPPVSPGAAPPRRPVSTGLAGNVLESRLAGASGTAGTFPIAVERDDIPDLAEMPEMAPAQIEKALAAKDGAKNAEAMHALRGLAVRDPAAAVAILNKLPAARSLEVATWVVERTARHDPRKADFLKEVLAHDPAFAGRWAAELAKGLKTGGTPGTRLLPPGTEGARNAVRVLIERHAADPRRLQAMVASMHRTGGDDPLTFALGALSDAGPTPLALSFLRALKGKECDNYLARVLGKKDARFAEERKQVEQAVANMLENIPMVTTDAKEWDDLATEVLGAAEEAIGNDPAARKEWKTWLQGLHKKWTNPAMVDVIRGKDEVFRETRTERTEETRRIVKQFHELRSEYASIQKISDYDERTARLRDLDKRLDDLKTKLDVNVKASGGLKVWRFPKIDIGLEVDYERQKHESKTKEKEIDVGGKIVRLRDTTLHELDKLVSELETYQEQHSKSVDEVKTKEDPSTRARIQILHVGSAIEDAARG